MVAARARSSSGRVEERIERLLGFGMLALLKELSPRVREATRAHPSAGPGDRVIARELIDDQSTRRLSKDLLGGVAASTRCIPVSDDLRRDEVPQIGTALEALLSNARFVRVHVGRCRHGRESRAVQRSKPGGGTVKQISHRAARDRDPDHGNEPCVRHRRDACTAQLPPPPRQRLGLHAMSTRDCSASAADAARASGEALPSP